MQRLAVITLPAAIAALALGACGGGSDSDSTKSASAGSPATGATVDAATAKLAKGGSITIGSASGIPQLNPVIRGTAWELVLSSTLWNGLTKIDENGKVAPDLATEWTPSADNKRWTFTLRDDVKFSNGTAVTPKLIVANFKYYRDPDTATQQKTALSTVKSVAADGSDKVVITLKAANVSLPSLLAPIKFIDPANLKSIDKDPAVTGPFMVKDFVPDDTLTLERNPDYFGDAAPLDEIKIVKASDATSAVTSLRSGDLDALWSVPPSDIASLKGEEELKIATPKVNGQYVSWEVDMTSPPFDDVRARQALAYAIDRDAILKAAYYGLGTVSKTNTPLPENSPDFGGQLTDYSYNPEKAKELFAAAGVKEITWWGVAGQYPEWNTSAQILQASLKDIGVTMKIKNNEIGSWPGKFYPAGKKYPGLVIPNFQSFDTDPQLQLGFLRTGRCECNWKNTTFEDTFAKALATPDAAARKAVWQAAQEQINKEVPIYVPLQYPVATAAKATVAGMYVDGTGTPHLESAGLAG